MRRDYTLALEIRPVQAISHGQGSEGNEQVLLTRQIVAPRADGLGGHERIEARRLRDLFPLLSVFGSFDGGLPIAAKIQVSDVTPWCAELERAGILPREVRPLEVEVAGTPSAAPAIALWPGIDPIPAALARTTETNYRHDLRTSSTSLYLEGEAAKRIEDAAVARKGKSADKAERRAANESMPYSRQVIPAGTPMWALIRLSHATEAEYGCLLVALFRWIVRGAHLGGGSSVGHGACSVRIAGAIEWSAGPAPAPGTEVSIPTGPEVAAGRAYEAHLAERREAVREYLGLGAPAGAA